MARRRARRGTRASASSWTRKALPMKWVGTEKVGRPDRSGAPRSPIASGRRGRQAGSGRPGGTAMAIDTACPPRAACVVVGGRIMRRSGSGGNPRDSKKPPRADPRRFPWRWSRSVRSIPRPALAVVVAELGLVLNPGVPRLVELGRVLDLILCPVDEHATILEVHPVDHAGRQHDLLAEDPRAGVDDDVTATVLGGRLVNAADPAVERLDL